jgi:hypothetical protein
VGKAIILFPHLLEYYLIYNSPLNFPLVSKHVIGARNFTWDNIYLLRLSEFTFRKITFQTFLCLFDIRKVGQRKTLFSQRKIWLGFQESVFLENLGGKHFLEVVKNLKMSYYLLIISNLVLKFLIAIYILFWIFIFQFHLLKFNFYINFGPYFYNCYLLFPYHFFIKMFYLSNLVLILLIVTFFFWNNLWNVNYYYFNFFIFQFFFIDLIFIIFIIIYFIWDNL